MNILKLSENLNGNDYVVGDIHGTFYKLEDLLSKINFDVKNDRLFSVGDMIDRGLDSFRIIEFMDQSWFYAIMGNHEDMLLDAFYSNSLYQHNHYHRYNSPWFYNLQNNIQRNMIEIIKTLPYIILIDDIAIIHAELPPSMDDFNDFLDAFNNPILYPNIKESCIWGRSRINNLRYYKKYPSFKDSMNIKNISKIFCGHNVVDDVTEIGNIIYCDTGSVFKDGKLSAVNIKTLESWSI